MARTALISLWLGLPLLVAANASADELPESVWLSIEDCSPPTLKPSEANNALRLELSQADVRIVREDEREQARAELTAQLRCEGGIRAILRLRQRQDRSSSSRIISLDDTSPKDRARVLALALTELVRSDWSELSRPSTDVPPHASAEQPAPTADATPATNETGKANKPARPPERVQRPISADQAPESEPAVIDNAWHWRADGLLRWFTASPHVTIGPAFGLTRGRFSAALEAALGRSSDDRGVVNYGFGAAALGLDAFTLGGARARFGFGPRVSLGTTWATGQSDLANVRSSNVVQLYADAGAECAVTVHTPAIEVGARISGGRANGLRLRDEQRTLGATGGWFMGAALGAGW